MIAQSAYKDLDSAFNAAYYLIENTEEAHAWTEGQRVTARNDLEAAKDDAAWSALAAAASVLLPFGGLIGLAEPSELEQVETFWLDLADRAQSWTGENADKLVATFESAAGTTELVAEQAELEETATIIVDGAAETTSELGEAAQAGGELVAENPWIPVALSAAIIGGVLFILTRR